MLKIKIPLTPVRLFVYVGKNELKKYAKKIKKISNGWEPENKMSGYSLENYIWIHKSNSKKTIIHELLHFLDWLYSYLSCENENEFKSYLGEWVILNVQKKIKRG
jgi:hypothetical protein